MYFENVITKNDSASLPQATKLLKWFFGKVKGSLPDSLTLFSFLATGQNKLAENNKKDLSSPFGLPFEKVLPGVAT